MESKGELATTACSISSRLRLLYHASWLNQIEVYFSIIQRKVLTPNDFASLELLAERLERFERHYEIIAKPLEWKFTRDDLAKLMQRLQEQPQPVPTLAAENTCADL